MSNIALIVAGGIGSRMGSAIPKQFITIMGKTILEWTIICFQQSPFIDTIALILPDDEIPDFCSLYPKIAIYGRGGQNRQESVYNGLQLIKKYTPKNILIHDAARPFVSQNLIKKLIDSLQNAPAVAPIYTINDAIMGNDNDKKLQKIQTPQAFHFDKIYQAHSHLQNNQFKDDTSIYAAYFQTACHYIQGEYANIKITTPDDLIFANDYLRHQMHSISAQGFDVHPYQVSDKKFMLGGIEIPANIAPIGHSDADCLLHALTDAILGLTASGDIGVHFPPNDPQWKNGDSRQFLQESLRLLRINGGILRHVDCTIIAEIPKINPHRIKIKENIAQLCQLPLHKVSIKATTTEQLGFIGRKEGIAVQAMASASFLLY